MASVTSAQQNNIPSASDRVLHVKQGKLMKCGHPRFYHSGGSGASFPHEIGMGLELLLEEAPGQEGKSEREKEWRILGPNMDAARPANFYRLLCAQADVGKIGHFIHTLLENAEQTIEG